MDEVALKMSITTAMVFSLAYSGNKAGLRQTWMDLGFIDSIGFFNGII